MMWRKEVLHILEFQIILLHTKCTLPLDSWTIHCSLSLSLRHFVHFYLAICSYKEQNLNELCWHLHNQQTLHNSPTKTQFPWYSTSNTTCNNLCSSRGGAVVLSVPFLTSCFSHQVLSLWRGYLFNNKPPVRVNHSCSILHHSYTRLHIL